MLLTFSGQGLHMDRFPPCGAKVQGPESAGRGSRFGDHSIQRAQSFRASGRVFLSAVLRSLEAEGSSIDELGPASAWRVWVPTAPTFKCVFRYVTIGTELGL